MNPLLTREVVLDRLSTDLPGKNLHHLAEHFGITVHKEGRLNKGWAGQTIECVAGLGLSNKQQRDGLDFELKSTSLVRKGNVWLPKETIKVTQLNLTAILEEAFEQSSLWQKLSRLILVGVCHLTPSTCEVVHIGSVDLKDQQMKEEIKAFWEDIRALIYADDLETLHHLGKVEDLIQLRPTGDGKLWSRSPISGDKIPAQAFYATKRLLTRILMVRGYFSN